ncbi:MAG: hypothetical protein L0Z55_08385, partial [Planctomycetes bacterium]|nr:hypothetical protein [Planctomycetota bacterium]
MQASCVSNARVLDDRNDRLAPSESDSPPRLRVRSLLLALALALPGAGCALFGRGPDAIDLVPAMRPLAGEELLVGPSPRGTQLLVTPAHALNLHYDAAGAEPPPRVVFMVRQANKDAWILGPSWSPGEPAPRWSPPWEGRWELCALPFSTRERPPALASQSPHVVVNFDWTAPHVVIEQQLPPAAVAGGTSVELKWRLTPGSAGGERVALEIADGPDSSWVKELELPNTGYFRWHVPTRPLAGARVRLSIADAAGNKTAAEFPGSLTITDRARPEESPAPSEALADKTPDGPAQEQSPREIPAEDRHGGGASREAPAAPPAQGAGSDAAAPRALLAPECHIASRQVEIPYDVRLAAGSAAKQVELWITEDGGESWNLAGYDTDCRTPFAARLAEGRYGYAIEIEDSLGMRGSYPRPGDAPGAHLTVDWSAPEIEWEEPEIRRTSEETFPGSAFFDVTVSYRVRDLDLDEGSLQFAYRAGSEEWAPIPEAQGAAGAIRLRIAERAAEPLAIRAAGRDRAGNGFSAELPCYLRDSTEPPLLEFTELPEGWHAAGERVSIAFRSAWHLAAPNPIDLYYRVARGGWRALATGLAREDSFAWTLPALEEEASVEIKLVMNGSHGRTMEAVGATPLEIDAFAPQVAILGPKRGHGEEIKLAVRASDRGGSGI